MSATPFVGRQTELESLRRQLDLAGQHGPRLVLVAAEAGASKTTLVRRFLDSLGNRCVTVIDRGWDHQAASPIRPCARRSSSCPGPRIPPPPCSTPSSREPRVTAPPL